MRKFIHGIGEGVTIVVIAICIVGCLTCLGLALYIHLTPVK